MIIVESNKNVVGWEQNWTISKPARPPPLDGYLLSAHCRVQNNLLETTSCEWNSRSWHFAREGFEAAFEGFCGIASPGFPDIMSAPRLLHIMQHLVSASSDELRLHQAMRCPEEKGPVVSRLPRPYLSSDTLRHAAPSIRAG